jgi:hemerythrin superfamily protein
MASKRIFDVLVQDHRKLDSLMKRVEKTEDGNQCMELFAELRTALLAHSQAEDEVFYARLEDDAETEELIGAARDQHQQVEDLIEELGEIEDDAAWMKRFADLEQAVDRHVQEEERQLFPRARRVFDQDTADELGREFTEIQEDEMEGLQAEAAGAEGDTAGEPPESASEAETRASGAAEGHAGGRRPGWLEGITKRELVERARARGVQGYSHMTKAQLIEALRR